MGRVAGWVWPPCCCREGGMKIVAVKPCPQGQQPGTLFDAPDAAAELLIRIGAARLADDSDLAPASESPRRRTYRRRDLQAES